MAQTHWLAVGEPSPQPSQHPCEGCVGGPQRGRLARMIHQLVGWNQETTIWWAGVCELTFHFDYMLFWVRSPFPPAHHGLTQAGPTLRESSGLAEVAAADSSGSVACPYCEVSGRIDHGRGPSSQFAAGEVTGGWQAHQSLV